MDEKSIQIGLAQLAAIIFCTAILISQPELALLILVVAGISFAFSLGCSLALANTLAQQRNIELHNRPLLGTHLGGIICYTIMLYQAIKYLAP